MSDTSAADNPSSRGGGLRAGSVGYRKLLIAMFCAGIATFAQLYAPQSLLPVIAREAKVTPDTAALCISVATGALAIGVLPWAMVAARFGRARTVSIAIVASALLGCLIPFAPNFTLFLLGRALGGLLMAAVPAVAVAFLAEQVNTRDTARAAGVYVAGTTVGGLLGRVVTGPLSEALGWHAALFTVAAGGLGAALVFVLLAPSRSPHIEPRSMQGFLARIGRSFRMRPLLQMYLQPFLLMGVFVALYNYLGFHLEAPPFALTASAVSLMYFSYLGGTFSSAWAGSLVQRFGFKRAALLSQLAMALGLALTLTTSVPVIIVGLAVHTAGFFCAHATLTSWTPLIARDFAAEASAGYSLSYYLGSSLVGWAAGLLLAGLGWHLTVISLVAIVGIAAVLTATSRQPESL